MRSDPDTASNWESLTKSELELISELTEFRSRHGVAPSLKELSAALNRPRSTVADQINALISQGVLRRDESRRRTLELVPPEVDSAPAIQAARQLPLLGAIAAGTPISAQEDVEQLIAVPESLIRHGEQAFLLQVRGDSMTGAGLLDGDLVVVNPTQTFHDGDIVAAMVGEDEAADEATVKRYRETRRKPGFELRPENPKYEVLPPPVHSDPRGGQRVIAANVTPA